MTEPTRRNYYAEIVSVCGMLRRMHLMADAPLDELAIDVDTELFRLIMSSMPHEIAMSQHISPVTRGNELLVNGVVIRAVEQGTRQEEQELMKRGFGKVWAIRNAKR